ncbi:uncharacterized protein LOC142774677 isoform X2 [Rhipicephalus microplus]|uniref:uncharacterized protein LOC142774677 isoform X2 n=1 Tax=Rhipicephalus microplus TaxID=6941 RepID=UPI003F6B06E2
MITRCALYNFRASRSCYTSIAIDWEKLTYNLCSVSPNRTFWSVAATNMPEEEEEDGKKGAKGGKKADKVKKGDKKGGKDKGGKGKGGKDKGGKGGKDKGSKGKGGKGEKGKGGKGKSGSKSGSKGGSKGGSKSGSKPSSTEGSVGKNDEKKDADLKPSKESIESPLIGSATEHQHETEDKHEGGAKDQMHEEKPGEGTPHGHGPLKPEEAKEGGEHKNGKHDADHKEGGVLLSLGSKEKHDKHDGHHKVGEMFPPSDSKEKHDKHDAHHKEGGGLSPSHSKEKHGKHDAHHKEGGSMSPSHSKEKHGKRNVSEKSSGSEKSSTKSGSSTEKTDTSKSETSEKSSEQSGSKTESGPGHKKPSILSHHKRGEHSKGAPRSLTAHGPVYAEHYFGDESDDDGQSYIEIQMFGRRHSDGLADQASYGAWNQHYYDAPPPPTAQGATASFTCYSPDGAQLQAAGQWSSNQQLVSSPEPGGYSEQYDDLTVSVWRGPQQQGITMDAGRSTMIAEKLKEMQQGLAQPLPDDTVTTERVIYEVTRGRPCSQAVDLSGAPPLRASSGPLVARRSQGASQFYGPPGISQAVVRHEMRQSSATRLHSAGPGGMRANSNHGMTRHAAPPAPSFARPPSAHSFGGHGGTRPSVSPRASKSGGGVQPQRAAEIIKQQADIIDRQSNIINQQSGIIDQQLGLVDAALRGVSRNPWNRRY